MSQVTEQEKLPLEKAVLYLLEECRMVLPGIQALFGFQMTVVFSPGFHERLSQPFRMVHLAATCLLALAIILIMTPAALHRQADPQRATERFARIASRLLLSSMVPLGISMPLEIVVVGKAVDHLGAFIAAATAILAAAVFFWFVLPQLYRKRGI